MERLRVNSDTDTKSFFNKIFIKDLSKKMQKVFVAMENKQSK